MSKEKEGKSHGDSIHRRRAIAQARREFSPDEFIVQRLEEPQRTKQRLSNIEILLEDNSLAPQQKVSLEIESIWLRFKIGQISSPNRQSTLVKLLNGLEKTQPEVYKWLTTENNDGTSPSAEIRDRVIPPTKIAGYHTKK